MKLNTIDPVNKSGVATSGGDIVLLFAKTRWSKEDALNMAAWIVALADESEDHEDFKALIDAVEAT